MANYSAVYVLPTGERVRYCLKKRSRDKYISVCFRDRALHGRKGKPRELSTGQPNIKRAKDAAISIIDNAFQVKKERKFYTWDETVTKMKEEMEAHNLRPNSIDSYETMIRNLRKVHPNSQGPSDITEEMAKRFKVVRSKEVKPETVATNINQLSSLWTKWLTKICDITTNNPFLAIEKPKLDQREKRIIQDDEFNVLKEWFLERWSGWRLPVLFLEVKSDTGCRIRELAYLKPTHLEEGRIILESLGCKGRKTRRSLLTPELFKELIAASGDNFVFESWSNELQTQHIKKGNPHHAKSVGNFRPENFVGWMQREIIKFRAQNPKVKYFKTHNLRGTAMSKARANGASYDDASVAFGCHPETMRKFYLNVNETKISDDVMRKIQRAGKRTKSKLG